MVCSIKVGMRWSPQWLLRYLILLSLAFWLLLFLVYRPHDSCEGQAYTHALCSLYVKGVIDGIMCPKLCLNPQHYLHSCKEDQSNYRVFTFHNSLVKVKNSRFLATRHDKQRDFGLLEVFSQPPEGTSPEEFNSMVLHLLEDHLGSSQDLVALVDHILDIADIDNDDKVSLGEARSIWALLQQQEFLITLLYQHTHHVIGIHGYCGDLYAVEQVDYTALYDEADKDSLVSYVFPNYYLFPYLSWPHRANIVLGVLEFIFELYEHDAGMSFHWCDLDPASIGYTSNYEVQFYKLRGVMSQTELASYFSNLQCSSDTDCVFMQSCQSICDVTNGKCSSEAIYPNLVYACRLIKIYLEHNLPREILGEMHNLYDRCFRLNSSMPNLLSEHSLVLLDLKSLIWKQIS